MKKEKNVENKDNFFRETKLTFAFVTHATLSDIQKVNEFLEGLDDLHVVYQRCSADRLYITEEDVTE